LRTSQTPVGAEHAGFTDGRRGATGQTGATIRQQEENTVQQTKPTRTSITRRARKYIQGLAWRHNRSTQDARPVVRHHHQNAPSDSAHPPSRGSAAKRLAAGTRRLVRDALRRHPDDRWAAAFGRVAGYSFAVAVVTGILLLPFFRPSMATVVYHGSYSKLDGAPMSQAYRSVLATSFDVRGGLLIRQVHHWSADVFVAAICLRLLRAFFCGRFSGRALPDWLIWVALLPLGMLAAYTGTLLPDDGLSGGSLSVITGVLLSVPVIGTHLVIWIFGGGPPGDQIIGRDYWVHILVFPVLAGALLLASFRPSVRWSRRIRLDPLLPFTCAVLVGLGAIAQINPVWLIGPYQPGSITVGAVPDWYMGFLDGPLRIMPAWELSVAGHPLALGVLIPGMLLPALFFTGLAVYPLADRRIAGGRPPHGALPPTPGDLANRTAAGAAGVTFYGLLWAASANDQIAYHLQIPLYTVTWIFRVLVLAGPALAFFLTRVICHALAGRRRDEELHGRETGRIVMNSQGGYTEIREPAHHAAPPTADPAEPATARRGHVAAPHPALHRPDLLAGPMTGSDSGTQHRS
jgi:ubiquinol-cytochrome c reductase cytochrome b subunit